VFFFGCLFATLIGRRIGWMLSRRVLYASSWTVSIILCFGWACGVAYGLRLFILAMHPGLILKVFGYGAGMYISIPNYGLVDEATIPESGRSRHEFIKGVPMVLFIVASVIFALVIPATSPKLVSDRLTPDEFGVLSSVLSKKDPLNAADLNSLKVMEENYSTRTGHRISRQDVVALTNGVNTANDYYYELSTSMLISWDSSQYQTTRDFDRLYAEMEKDGQRKPQKLLHDKDRIRFAAEHRATETDEGGLEYELSREGIVETMNQINIAKSNDSQVISVLNSLAQ
jgi:hypothetical protein